MSRKAIQGYTEKSYYDNTRFRGIVATNDPLNEGSFKHLVNFDISDTGQSIEARKGFLSTRLNNQSLNKNTVYFLDPNIGKYIFVDFSKYNGDTNTGMALISDLTLLNKQDAKCPYYNVQPIANIDISDLTKVHSSNSTFVEWVTQIVPVSSHLALLAYDENTIPRNLIRVVDSNKVPMILTLTYRAQGTRFEDYVYEKDTLVISYVDLNELKSINMTDRNIASNKSIIPDPIQHIYEDPNDPDSLDPGTGDISRLPLVYVKDVKDKYILETSETFDNLTYIPHFILRHENTYNIGSGEIDLVSDYQWCYTYDIVSLNKYKEGVYRAPIYDLRTNQVIHTTQNQFNAGFSKIQNLYKDPDTQTTPVAVTDHEKLNECYKTNIWDSTDFLSTGHTKNTYVLYLVPKPASLLGAHTFSTKAWDNDFSKAIWVGDNYDNSLAACLRILFYNNKEYPNDSCIFRLESEYKHYFNGYTKLPSMVTDGHVSTDTLSNFLDQIISLFDTECDAYIVPFTEITHDYNDGSGTLFTSQQTALSSKLLITNEKPISLSSAKSYFMNKYNGIEDEEIFSILIRGFNATYSVDLKNIGETTGLFPNSISAKTLFPGIFETSSSHRYYIYAQYDSEPIYNALDVLCGNFCDNAYPITHKRNEGGMSYYINDFVGNTTYYSYYFKKYSQGIVNSQSIFTYKNEILQSTFGTTTLYKQLDKQGFFADGVLLIFYILYMPKIEYVMNHNILYDVVSRAQQVLSTPYQSVRKITYSPQPSYIVETITKEPTDIQTANNLIIFREPKGDRLVTWAGNTVYMSEPNNYNYFKYIGKKEYPNTVIKVIQYKDTLLVFTTSDVYSIFPYENVTTIQDGVNDKGEPKYAQVKSIVYNTLPVLYNLMIDEKYKDAIQVFNQMVLFYSADGQMFMIKPSATVDSNTRFSIQYFNKNANDILENYDQYINERLTYYGKDKISKEDVKINVQLSINSIKIFYTVPNVITYILVYDVIKNNYYVYDTISFTEILDILSTNLGDVYITPQDTKLYLTQQYNNIFEYNNNIDIHEFNSNIYNPVLAELDTGVLNLNNHLKKRFKEVQTTYKNLNAQELEFALEVYVDDVPVYTYYNPTLDVVFNTNDQHQNKYQTEQTNNVKNILKDNTILFDFSDYNYNATLAHKTNIISKGKTIRLKFIFKSQGKYKVLGYGLIYKERRV